MSEREPKCAGKSEFDLRFNVSVTARTKLTCDTIRDPQTGDKQRPGRVALNGRDGMISRSGSVDEQQRSDCAEQH